MGCGQGALEGLVMAEAFWRGRRVLVTGHTGFKGGWLSLWLRALGAEVHGYALNPPTQPSLFEVARIGGQIASDTRADLADLVRLRSTFSASLPEIVFHLAAQPLVRESYRDPLGTLNTNIMGTAHVLEAAKNSESVRSVVVITTDKVYENLESGHAYQETDPLGGHDPYSASKAAAEIVTASYRRSFFEASGVHGAQVATARTGNVIGGGDWALERLVPDCLRAFDNGEAVHLRRPNAVRPWQHVLDPLLGYLLLAQNLASSNGTEFTGAWNFGPDVQDDATVGDVAEAVARLWGGGARVVRAAAPEGPHEAGLLHLDSRRARTTLRWKPRSRLDDALARTVSWHRAWKRGTDMHGFCLQQIHDYEAAVG